MGGSFSKNHFPVKGRTVVVTGGSTGMGLEVARQLAQKGANVAIVARNQERLLNALEYVQAGALDVEAQVFCQISADLADASECERVVEQVVAWNSGAPPDILWCCAGSSHPTLFADMPPNAFRAQMDSNYFSSVHMAHGVVRRWLNKGRGEQSSCVSSTPPSPPSSSSPPPPARHVIFTSSFLALYTFGGYTAYSPSKAALRSLSDTLSQEMNLYAGAHPHEPAVRSHVIFPATIISPGLEAENRIKPDVTSMLEEGDAGQLPAAIAAKSISSLEAGRELVTTDSMTWLVQRGALSGSIRGGFVAGAVDWVVASCMAVVMVLVRRDMDGKVGNFGSKFGSSGMKQEKKDRE